MDYAKLTEDLVAACNAGKLAADRVQDLGSCCLDHFVMHTGKDCVVKRMTKKVVAAIEAAGCGVSDEAPYTIHLPDRYGQASKRCLGMQAACDHMQAQGWDCYMHYVLD